MSEHTPEPWENHIGTIESESGWHIASCVTTNGGKAIANAARIVACVNACAGMEDPAAEIAKLRAEREELLRRIDNFRDEFLEKALEWRGISFVDEACDKCGGSGVVAYGSTATWHGGIGGQAITNGVCDKCWGSGSKVHKGADLRKLSAVLAEKGE